jgi:hypothetical protein
MITKLLLDTIIDDTLTPAGTPVAFLGFAPGDQVAIELPDGTEANVDAARVEAAHEPEMTLPQLEEATGVTHDALRRAANEGRLLARKVGREWVSTETAVEYAQRQDKIR